MEAAMNELPLALFSTLAPMGAGAFGLLTLAFLTTTFSEDRLKKIDQLTAIPLIVVLIGFVCSFFHLASPLNAFQVFAGVGSSPLSNEIVIGVLFTAFAIVYWILAVTGKLSNGARKALSLIVAVLAAVFAVFVGLAYSIETIPSWNTMLVPVQMLGYLLVGGATLGVLVLGLAGVLDEAREGTFKMATIAIAIVGAVLAIVGLVGQITGVNGLENAIASGAALASEATPAMIAAVVLIAASALAAAVALFGTATKALATAAPVLAVVGIFAARLAFYAVQMSVGLCIS